MSSELYDIAQGSTIGELKQAVNIGIRAGMLPLGGVTVNQNGVLIQAMVRPASVTLQSPRPEPKCDAFLAGARQCTEPVIGKSEDGFWWCARHAPEELHLRIFGTQSDTTWRDHRENGPGEVTAEVNRATRRPMRRLREHGKTVYRSSGAAAVGFAEERMELADQHLLEGIQARGADGAVYAVQFEQGPAATSATAGHDRKRAVLIL